MCWWQFGCFIFVWFGVYYSVIFSFFVFFIVDFSCCCDVWLWWFVFLWWFVYGFVVCVVWLSMYGSEIFTHILIVVSNDWMYGFVLNWTFSDCSDFIRTVDIVFVFLMVLVVVLFWVLVEDRDVGGVGARVVSECMGWLGGAGCLGYNVILGAASQKQSISYGAVGSGALQPIPSLTSLSPLIPSLWLSLSLCLSCLVPV